MSSPVPLYNLAKDAGLTDSQISEQILVMMAGVGDIEIRRSISNLNPMLSTRTLGATFFVPSKNPKSIVDGYQIYVERIVRGGV